jgi:hypothetical protein
MDLRYILTLVVGTLLAWITNSRPEHKYECDFKLLCIGEGIGVLLLALLYSSIRVFFQW